MGRHPVDVLKAALQEAKTEAATLRIKTATLAKERNVVIEERNKARARVKELEQQNAVQRENVDEAMRQNTSLQESQRRFVELWTEVREHARLAKEALAIADGKAGQPLRRVAGWLGATLAHVENIEAALSDYDPASDKTAIGQPEPCPPSSVTGKACLLPPGHPADSPTRFHRYAGPDPEARIRELEAEVQRLQQDRAQVGAFGFRPLGIR